ncbi:hypothetical protein [Desulfohalovibrio reitneri]|uniref:hypothetical protein n=1 Tax=Desulfohalovibrio reitneri TaxID=1307759 RepID=UPI0013766697|nr:hypothetical protein [Desulfohalovibrio reitneri]
MTLLATAPAWGANGTNQPPGESGYSGYTLNPDTAPDRRDNTMGTGEGRIRFGRDPATGDRTMEVGPAGDIDKEEDCREEDPKIGPIEPVIILPEE